MFLLFLQLFPLFFFLAYCMHDTRYICFVKCLFALQLLLQSIPVAGTPKKKTAHVIMHMAAPLQNTNQMVCFSLCFPGILEETIVVEFFQIHIAIMFFV